MVSGHRDVFCGISPSSGIVGGDVIVAEGPETCASLVAISPPDVHVVAALSVGNFAKLAKYIISKKPKVINIKEIRVRKGGQGGPSAPPTHTLKEWMVEISGTSDFCW